LPGHSKPRAQRKRASKGKAATFEGERNREEKGKEKKDERR